MGRRFAIAGFAFEIDCESDSLASLDEDWRDFRSTERAQARIRLELTAPLNRVAQQQQPLPAVTRAADGSLAIAGDGFAARVDADRRFALVKSPPERFPLEAVVRILLSDFLLGRDGLLLHSVAVAVEGRAAVFAGESGAGKSTLGALCRDAGLCCLSDELVAVIPGTSGYAAFGTPWNIGRSTAAELLMLGLLEHAELASVDEQPAGELLRALLPNALMPDPSAAIRAQMFRCACALIGSVKPVRLRFAKDAAAARALVEALRARKPG